MNKILYRVILLVLVSTLILSLIPVSSQHVVAGNNDVWYAKFHPHLLQVIGGSSDNDVYTLMIRLQPLPHDIAERVRGHHDLAVKALKDWARLTQSRIIPKIKALGGIVLNRFWLDNVILVKAPLKVFKAVAKDPLVVEVLENFEVHVIDAQVKKPVEPGQEVESWGIFKIRAPDAWAMGYTGEGVRIAVLDTGVDITHPALQGKMLTLDPSSPYYPGGWMEWDGNGNPVLSTPHDTHGHGTHTSGTALGGDTENILIGVAPGATLMHGLVLPGGGGTFAQVLAGMEWTVDPYYIDPDTGELVPTGLPAHVVSMSWGAADYYGNDLLPAIEAMLLADIIPVAAAGNCGPGCTDNPGNIWGAFAVGATDEYDNVASWSSGAVVTWPEPPEEWPFFGGYPDTYIKPDFSAPGVDIVSSVPGGGYEAWSGTSMATPHVSGTVALILQAAGWMDFNIPDLPEMVYTILNTTSIDFGDPGQDIRYGWGRIDAAAAVELAQTFAKKSGVEGFVLDNVDHTPIPWATVTVEELNMTVGVNKSGYFKIPLDPGTYHLLFQAWGYISQEIIVNVTLLNGTITGVVVNGITGQPIAGAYINVTELNLTVTTNANGTFNVSVPPGKYHLIAWAPGFQESVQEVSVDENETVFVFFSLLPTGYGSIHGYVLDSETGMPIANATVILDDGLLVNFTDVNGYYELNNVIVGNHTITVFKPGYMVNSTWIFVEPNMTYEVNFTLSPIPPSIVVLGNTDYYSSPHLVDVLSQLGYPVVSYDDLQQLFIDWFNGMVNPRVIVIDHYHSDLSMPTLDELMLLINASIIFNTSLVFLGTSYSGATGINALYEYHDELISYGLPAVSSYTRGWPSPENVLVDILNISSPVFENVTPVNDTWFYLANISTSDYADYLAVSFDPAIPVDVLALVNDTSSDTSGVGVAYWVSPSGSLWFYLSSWGESYWMQYLEPGSDGEYSVQTTQVLLNAVRLAFEGGVATPLPLRFDPSLLRGSDNIAGEESGDVSIDLYTYVEVYLDREPYGYVKGHVVGSDGLVIAGARINVLGTPVSAVTNESGDFMFWLPAGNYTLLITARGYSPLLVSVTVNVNETTDLDTLVLERIPRVAVLYDFAGEIKGFLEFLGYYVEDYNDLGQLTDAISTGFFDLVIYAGHYGVPFPDYDTFMYFLDTAESLKLPIIWLDQWGYYGYGIKVLSTYTGDPAGFDYDYGVGYPYLRVLKKHFILRQYGVGEEIQLFTQSYADFAWFYDFSGEVIASMVVNGYEYGASIGYKYSPSGAKWILMSGFAPEEWTPMEAWTLDTFQIFANAVKWALLKPVNLTLANPYLHVGDTAVATITGAPSHENFTITLDGEYLMNVVTDENGTVTFLFTIPKIPGGEHLLEAWSIDEEYYGSAKLMILPKITVSPTKIIAPGMVAVDATGLFVNQTIDIYLDGNYLSRVTADSLGSFTLDINIPLVASGEHYVKLVDIETGKPLATAPLNVTSQLDIIEGKIDNIGASSSEVSGKLDEVLSQLSTINGVLSSIQGDVATIKTDTGEIKVKLDELNATLVGLITTESGEVYALINTTKGLILADINDVKDLINTKAGNLADLINEVSGKVDQHYNSLVSMLQNMNETLQEILGQVQGTSAKLSSLEGTVNSLQGDVNSLKTRTQTVSEDLNKTKKSVESASSTANTATMIGGGAIVLSLIALALPFIMKR